MPKGMIVILNGVSSAGKTTLARSFQESMELPYYYFSQDMFRHLVSKRHRDTDLWGIANQSLTAMHHTIMCYSDLGLNLIVDHVLLDKLETKGWLEECVTLLHAYPVLFVEVWCPIEELERREKERGDRQIGQARRQIAHSYDSALYDLTVNTYEESTETSIAKIKTAIEQPECHLAFTRLWNKKEKH